MAFRGGMEFDDEEVQWHASWPLAGRYISEKSLKNTLAHAVPDRFYRKGKIFRAEGEALCKKSIGMADPGQWQPANRVTCPKCMNALIKMGVL